MDQIAKVIVVSILNKIFFLIHISTNQITKVDHNAFLSVSKFRNLSLSYYYGRDSWITNARD